MPGLLTTEMTSTTKSNQHLTAELRRFATMAELRRSDFYRAHEAELRRLLAEPRVYRATGARPRLRSFLRVVEWNIERGTRLEGIVEVLNAHPVLRWADLLLLNELDEGMVRSANRNVALELSRALSAHAIYGVEYLEMTRGTGQELELEGENTSALHGNAILTRHGFSDPQIISLPRCENNFESAEKRLGGRIGILVDLEIGAVNLVVANTHLDVVNTPRCRARQLRALLEAADARAQGRPVVVGGDFNTHTFARGGRLRSTRNAAIILGSKRERITRRLLNPQVREPALAEFARFGFDLDSFNDRSATARGMVTSLNDARRLPAPMRLWVRRRIGPSGLLLEFRLDWLAARGVRALGAGEVIDAESGVESVKAQTIAGLAHAGQPLSDHAPIVVDLAIGKSKEAP
jgi:endonuclease/exonuclease/phosphatase family metal-dependent hydrolase